MVTYVRYGEKVYSPVIEKGEANMIISFELLEAARWMPYLRPEGVIITNTQKINPMPVITGQAKYPENILEKIRQTGLKVIPLDAKSLAEKAGNVKSVNMVLLGVAARYLHLDKSVWVDAITATVPQKTVEINLKAFDYGYSLKEE